MSQKIKTSVEIDGSLTANSIVKSGGTASQILAADGSVVTAGSGVTISGGTISASGSAGVLSFNTRTGAVTLTSGDVTTALGYAPYNASNPAGYISSYTETDTLASVTARGSLTNTPITIAAGTLNHVTLGDRFNLIGGSNLHITNNAYYDSGFKYKFADLATKLALQADGILSYQTAVTGTVGSAVTFDTKFSVDSSGNLIVPGTLSASGYNKTNWDTAYGWGNHASAGYATSGHTHGLGRHNLAAPALIDSLTTSNFRSTFFGTSANDYQISTARFNSVPAPFSGLNMYGTAFAWSGADTHGFLAVDYIGAAAIIGGGNGQSINWTKRLAFLDDTVPNNRTITINGTSYDLSANRSWTVTASETDTLATVTSRGASTSTRPSFDGGITVNGQSYVTNSGYFVSGANGFRWNDSSGSYNNVIMRDNGTTWFRNYLETPDSMRSPIYYDSNDTSYYLEANGTSRLYQVNAPQGYISNGNPWGTANSAYFPNGITTAGSDNWIYGHTYVGNAPANGAGHEFWSTGKEYHRSSEATTSQGASGRWLSIQSANGNFIPYSFESEYGNHSWGTVARFRINQSGADRPSIQFSNASNDTRWNIGYCYADDNFRIVQNMGYRNDNSTSDGWGTQRLLLDTAGNFYSDGLYQSNASLRAPIFYDSADTSYYWNPNTSSGHRFQTPTGYLDLGSMNGSWCHFQTDRPNFYFGSGVHVNGGVTIYGTSSYLDSGRVQAPIFYDSNDTSYYIDPAGSSNLSVVAANRYISNAVNNTGGLALNNASTYWGLVYNAGANDWRLGYGASNSAVEWNLRWDNGNTVWANGSFRAPIFYDSNNTGYYVDPASTSNLNGLTVANTITGSVSGNSDTVDGYHGDTFYRNLGFGSGYPSWNLNTVDPDRSGFTYSNGGPWTGPFIHIGASGYGLQFNASYGGNGTGISYRTRNGDNGSWNSWFRMYSDTYRPYADDSGTTGQRSFNYLYASSYLESGGAVYGTIFYDNNNRGYYMDPDGTSQLSSIYTNNWVRVQGDSGVYSQDYGGHLRRPVNASHGTWEIFGYNKNGYAGMNVYDPQGYNNNYMHESGNGGLYQQNGNGWVFYHSRGNACFGVMTSTTSSSYKLYVGGSIYAEGDVVAYSDRRKKENIVTVDNALDTVNKLRGVYYNRIDDDSKKRQVGVIAQEIQEVLPEVVTYAKDLDEYGVSYGNITGLLIEAIKEQQAQIEELKELVNKLINK